MIGDTDDSTTVVGERDHRNVTVVGPVRRSKLFIFSSLLVIAGVATPSIGEAKRRRSKIPDLTKDGLPNIRSEAAFVVEIDSGELVYAKNPDERREIASTGKIFVAMAVLAKGLDLDAKTTIIEADRKAAKGGARSRLAVGWTFSNRDLLAAMLIGSDNRAATALGRSVGLDTRGLTDAMQEVADSLGLTETSFADPSGLKGNFSTAREMATALAAALESGVIADLMGAKSYVVPLSRPIRKQTRLIYYNTNQLLHQATEVVAGKTGFTTAAGYCLILAAELKERKHAAIFLGGDGKKTRFADYKRLRRWLYTK